MIKILAYFLISLILYFLINLYFYIITHPSYKVQPYSEVKDKLKTGDIVLFHALDNIFPTIMACYFTHIGIIYEHDDGKKYLFEAFNPKMTPYYPKEISNGIICSELENRLTTYRGYICYKELGLPLKEEQKNQFKKFINYAQKNMFYYNNVVKNYYKKVIYNETLQTGTNCAELVYLSLISLNLLHPNEFSNNNKYHLKWLTELTNVCNNYYKEPVYVYSEYYQDPLIL